MHDDFGTMYEAAREGRVYDTSTDSLRDLAADERVKAIRGRLEAREALAEYDKIPVRDLVEGLGNGDVDRYSDLMEGVRRMAWGDYPDSDLAYLLAEYERLEQVVTACDSERDDLIEKYESALAAAREENERLREALRNRVFGEGGA